MLSLGLTMHVILKLILQRVINSWALICVEQSFVRVSVLRHRGYVFLLTSLIHAANFRSFLLRSSRTYRVGLIMNKSDSHANAFEKKNKEFWSDHTRIKPSFLLLCSLRQESRSKAPYFQLRKYTPTIIPISKHGDTVNPAKIKYEFWRRKKKCWG